MKGYIKDYRQELQSDIWLMPPMYHRVWQFLKYMVNHDARTIPMDDGSTLEIKPGQHLTSVRKIAAGVGYYEQGAWKQPNPRTVQRILEWLKKNDMIKTDTGHGNTRYTLVTLLQWESYQSKESDGNSKTTVSTQSVQRNKNVKNDKEIEEEEAQAPLQSIQTWESNFGMMKQSIGESIIDWVQDTSDELVTSAIKLAVKKGGKTFIYVENILVEWQQHQINTVEKARIYEQDKQKEAANGWNKPRDGGRAGRTKRTFSEEPKYGFEKAGY